MNENSIYCLIWKHHEISSGGNKMWTLEGAEYFCRPLYKLGNFNNPSNCRPISLCTSVSKCVEKIVAKHLTNHMYRCGLVSDWQHGFLPKRCCITQLTTVYHHCAKTLDSLKQPQIDAIFLDWSKSFEHVRHGVLLDKLHRSGICGSVLQWFQSYLTGN